MLQLILLELFKLLIISKLLVLSGQVQQTTRL